MNLRHISELLELPLEPLWHTHTHTHTHTHKVICNIIKKFGNSYHLMIALNLDVTPCSLVDRYIHFRGIYCFHFTVVSEDGDSMLTEMFMAF